MINRLINNTTFVTSKEQKSIRIESNALPHDLPPHLTYHVIKDAEEEDEKVDEARRVPQ